MGGDKVPTPFDEWVELFEAHRRGEIAVSWDMDGMHVVKSHPCDSCISEMGFDSEDCVDCDKEMEQVTYVPPHLRREIKRRKAGK